jgi:hypothetical protein
MRTSPSRARIAPAPAYAPVTPSAAAAPRRRPSKRTNAAVPVPEASAARRVPPPTMATPGPACLALAVSSRRATSTCSRATTTTCWAAVCTSSSSGRWPICSPGTDIRPLVTRGGLPVSTESRCRRRGRPSARPRPVRGRPAPDRHELRIFVPSGLMLLPWGRRSVGRHVAAVLIRPSGRVKPRRACPRPPRAPLRRHPGLRDARRAWPRPAGQACLGSRAPLASPRSSAAPRAAR